MIHTYSTFIESEGIKLYTMCLLPDKVGKFPVVLLRSPYVDSFENTTDSQTLSAAANDYAAFLDNGYAVIYQHCRGRGKSDGDCVPYINERTDSLALQAWVRTQPFYNGEIYLCGKSYTTSVHYVTAPFADDIKGCVFEVQDSERYNIIYRNGFFKSGLHGSWYVSMYKHKSIKQKNHSPETFNTLPLSSFSKTVFGENAHDFDESLRHPDKNDAFWQTHLGGCESHDALNHANIPILLVTGFYDIYTGGIFDMWNNLDESTKAKSALIVHPYDHSNNPDIQPIKFENASLTESLGDYQVKWLNYIRNKAASPCVPGKVTYYRLFDSKWACEDFERGAKQVDISLGEGEISYIYNPYSPAHFKGGLSANFGGAAWQDEPNSRYDIKSFFSREFDADTFIKGKCKAHLCVKSDCEDTCFYVRISLVKEDGTYGLRDDIQKISNFAPNYVPGDEVVIDFSFDEHAFMIKKGEKIRIDVSSSASPLYVRHTNTKGLFSEQACAKIAHNTVILDKSFVTLFAEE